MPRLFHRLAALAGALTLVVGCGGSISTKGTCDGGACGDVVQGTSSDVALLDAPGSPDVQLPTDVLSGTDAALADVTAREVAVPVDTNGSQDTASPADAGPDGQTSLPWLDAGADTSSDGRLQTTGDPVDANGSQDATSLADTGPEVQIPNPSSLDAGADTSSDGDGTSSGFSPCPATGDCRVLPLGDSITYGSTSNNGGYRVGLFSRAHQDNKHLTFLGSQANGPTTVAGAPFPRNNEGHPGWTIQQISDISTTTNGLKGDPNIVLMHIGTNDMQATPPDPTGASGRLDALIDKITTALPNALLVVSSIIPLPWRESSAVAYNATIPGVVKMKADAGKHVIYVEMHDGFPSNGLGTDNIHPNDTSGYPWMGDTWYAAIKDLLR